MRGQEKCVRSDTKNIGLFIQLLLRKNGLNNAKFYLLEQANNLRSTTIVRIETNSPVFIAAPGPPRPLFVLVTIITDFSCVLHHYAFNTLPRASASLFVGRGFSVIK